MSVWQASAWSESLTRVAGSTRAVYSRDLAALTRWLDERGVDGPGSVDRRTLRRYLAHLDHAGYARRTIARKASVRKPFCSRLTNHCGVALKIRGVLWRQQCG